MIRYSTYLMNDFLQKSQTKVEEELYANRTPSLRENNSLTWSLQYISVTNLAQEV